MRPKFWSVAVTSRELQVLLIDALIKMLMQNLEERSAGLRSCCLLQIHTSADGAVLNSPSVVMEHGAEVLLSSWIRVKLLGAAPVQDLCTAGGRTSEKLFLCQVV